MGKLTTRAQADDSCSKDADPTSNFRQYVQLIRKCRLSGKGDTEKLRTIAALKTTLPRELIRHSQT